MNAFNRRSRSHRCLCLIMAALTVYAPAAAMAQQPARRGQPIAQTPAGEVPTEGRATTDLLADAKAEPLDAASLVPSACAAIAVRPAQLLKSPLMEMFPVEVVQAALMKEFGLDPLTAEQVILSAAAPEKGPPHYAVVAKFSRPFQMKPDSELTRHAAKATIDGKPYLKSSQPMLPSFYPLSPTVLLAAPEYTLPQFVDPQAAAAAQRGKFAAQFAAASQGDDLFAMLDAESLRPLISQGLAQAQGQMPPQAQQFLEIPNLVRQIELRLNLSRPAPSELIVAANNEADADRLVELFNAAKQLLFDQVAAEAAKGLASDDPVERAGAQYSQRMMRTWDERLQLTREGQRLVLFRHEGGAPANPAVTAATIGVLVALLLPAVQAAREAARRSVAQNNMNRIMLALHAYHAAQKKFPTQANYDAQGKPLLSWRVHILPYLDQDALYRQFHLDEPWDSDHNKQLIAQMPEVYVEPSSSLGPGEGKTHFVGVAGPGYFFDDQGSPRSIKQITDGTSYTIALVQTDDKHAVIWTKPDDWTPDAKNPLAGLGGVHPGAIFIAALGDGSVRIVGYSIDKSTLKAMFTIAGNEPVAAP
ncbi:MAG: DUF1559 domain-containing protein [Pirellulales bacterium]|nr:DUF1559 domain-containing protein [Pirellulales bacterium]